MLFVFAVFCVFVLIQLIYYTGIFTKFLSIKPENVQQQFSNPISVIVCAKNELENLKKLIPQLLEQEYTNFELVLVNDNSFDGTRELIDAYCEKYPNKIKALHLDSYRDFYGSKKLPLTLGIKAAKHEHLLFTDADCIPNSTLWIQTMANQFANNKSIVLGYGAYHTLPGFINTLIRYETVMTAIQYFSYAKLGVPYMGVGRNLAYTKSLFFENNGFASHMHIKSGDDDLFISETATKENVGFCISEVGFTSSEPKLTFKDWIKQKRRHVTTSETYKTKTKLLLGLFYMSQILFWGLGLLLSIIPWELQFYTIGIMIIRLLVQLIILNSSCKKLNEKGIVGISPILDLFLVLLQFYIFIRNIISKPTNW